MLHSDLIYDVGAHHGEDTAYFLQQGFRVVAIEANPLLAKRIGQQLSVAVASGALTILNIAVSDTSQLAIPFYISREDWRSSVAKHIAERETSLLETVEVPARTLADIFNQYGSPYYCKIDIEGNDEKAIRSMDAHPDRPTYLSCEISCRSIAELHQENEGLFSTLNALQSAGYTQFQLLDQYNLVQLDGANHYARLHKLPVRLFAKFEWLTGQYSPKYNNRLYLAKKRNAATEYVTAPFGTALTGIWYDYATTQKHILYHFHDYYSHTKNKEYIFWVDIHAKR